jgi:MFS family permease
MLQRNVRVFYTTQLLHSLIFTLPIWIAYYQGKLSPAEISIIVTVGYFSQMIMELPSGALADMIGRKLTNTIGFFVGAIAYIILPFATNFWHFLLFEVLYGVMSAFRSGAEEALIYDTFKQEKKEAQFEKAYANGSLLYQVGLIIAGAAGGYMYDLHYAIPFLAHGAALLTGTVMCLFYIEPRIDSERFSLRSYVKHLKQGTREAFKNQYTSALSLFYIFVGGITWSTALYFYPYMMTLLIVNNGLRGLLSSGMRLINALLIRVVLQKSEHITFERRVWFFPAIILFSHLPGIFLEGIWGMPFIQGAMMASTTRWILLAPVTNSAFTSKYRATAISVLSLFIGIVYTGLTLFPPQLSRYLALR